MNLGGDFPLNLSRSGVELVFSVFIPVDFSISVML